ncbi:Uncharacterised protein r2_g313 [Pycnogonum litorale]
MNHRSYPSGAHKRAVALEKKKRECETAEKTHKLTTFFKPTASTSTTDVEQSSTPKTETTVETENNGASEPVVNLDDAGAANVVDEDVISNDLHLWPENIRSYWIQRGSASCQNKDGDFKESVQLGFSQRRYCNLAMFTRVHERTGEKFERYWLCYSKTTRVYFFICKLMSTTVGQLTSGLNDWKHAHEKLLSHENSKQHLQAMAALCARKSSSQVDLDPW